MKSVISKLHQEELTAPVAVNISWNTFNLMRKQESLATNTKIYELFSNYVIYTCKYYLTTSLKVYLGQSLLHLFKDTAFHVDSGLTIWRYITTKKIGIILWESIQNKNRKSHQRNLQIKCRKSSFKKSSFWGSII